MTTILILSAVIAGLGTVSFIWIKRLYKKNKSQKKKIDYLDSRIDFYQKNKQVYQATTEKLTKRRKNAIQIREKIDSSDGSDLADILNGL